MIRIIANKKARVSPGFFAYREVPPASAGRQRFQRFSGGF